MRVFVTVGTTKFDSLVRKVLTEDVLLKLKEKGYSALTIQTGKSNIDNTDLFSKVLEIVQYDYKPSLAADIESADLVISHAGAGTCLEVLEAKKPLIVVVNEDLMNNHQTELAEKLSHEGHLVDCVCSTLIQTLDSFNPKGLREFPPGDLGSFSEFMDGLFDVRAKKD